MGTQTPQPPGVQCWVGSAPIPFRISLLNGSCCGRQWLWSLSAAQRYLPNSQHCSLHWAAGNRMLFIGLTYTPCWWWHLMSSALQKFCVVCNAHGFLWEEIFDYFPLPMNWDIPTLLSIIMPLVRAVHSWQDLCRQEYILLTVGCAGSNSKGESMVFHVSHYFSTCQMLLDFLLSKHHFCSKVFHIHMELQSDLSILGRTGGLELDIANM